MLRDNLPRRGRGIGNSRGPLILELRSRVLSCIQNGVRIAFAAGLLACFGLQAFCASSTPAPAALTVQRSTRVFPHRFNVHPDGATIAANQTQRFEVTDAEGKTVAVHWNISGLGCSGLACGTIDDQGVYRTPSTLPHPGVVILEGVLDSNPNYSVLTQIELVPGANTGGSPNGSPSGGSPREGRDVTPAPVQVAAEPQTIPNLSGEQNLARNTVQPPLPAAVAAAPLVERQLVARASPQPSQPTVTRPLPVIEGNNVAPEHSVLPLPNAVAASPTLASTRLERQTARASQPPPTPSVTAPLPVIEAAHVAPGHSLPPLPDAVAAAPVAERQIIARASPPPPLPSATAPLPTVDNRSVSPRHTIPSVPNAAAVGPSAKTQTIDLESMTPPGSVSVRVPVNEAKSAPSGHLPPPALSASSATPAVQTQIVARSSVPPPLSNVTLPSPAITGTAGNSRGNSEGNNRGNNVAAGHVLTPSNTIAAAPPAETHTIAYNTAPLPSPKSPSPVAIDAKTSFEQMPKTTVRITAPVAGGNVASRAILQPLQDEAAGSAAVTTAPDAPIVTYRDGQLTIDAKNSTLAEVLRLVAEKSGAKIEVPPGSGLERIYEHAGPGPAQDVLVRLLNGSAYDFIIVSSPQTPNAPAQVLLSLRGAEPPSSPAGASVSQVTSAAVQQKADGSNPYLWTPPTSAPLFSNGESDPVVQRLPAVAPPDKPIPPDQLEQMLKDYSKQLRGGPPPQ
jgi:hypothetical protein